MRVRNIAAVFCCLLAAACSDRQNQPTAPAPNLKPNNGGSTSACLSPSAAQNLIQALLRGGERNAAQQRYEQVLYKVNLPDTASAQNLALQLIEYLVKKYQDGRMIGGQSPATQAQLNTLLNGILCTVGLPPAFGPGTLGPDGAAAFIFPTTPDTNVVTETQWAGVNVPAASVTVPTLVTIQRLPDFPGPLLTVLDQYPIYYQFHSTPAIPFSQDLVVGVCVADNATPPDPARLRLAHNVAPFTPNSAEILPLAAAPFIDCTSAPIAAGYSRWGFDLARISTRVQHGLAAVLLPQPLLALPFYGAGGVGGTVRTFSPFGAVDTLGGMTRLSPTDFQGPLGGPAAAADLPTVQLLTPTGQPMPGVLVTFAITSGGGTLGGASVLTDASGVAKLGSWIHSATPGVSTVYATATMAAGSGLTGNPMKFMFGAF